MVDIILRDLGFTFSALREDEVGGGRHFWISLKIQWTSVMTRLSECLTMNCDLFVVARGPTAVQTYKVKAVHSTICSHK